MANLYRLVPSFLSKLLLVLLVFSGGSASAAMMCDPLVLPTQAGRTFVWTGPEYITSFGPTRDIGVIDTLPNGGSTPVQPAGYVTPKKCTYPPSCPSNSTLGSGVCKCNAGFNQSGYSCVADVNNCKAGASAGRFGYPYTAGRSISAPYYVCDGESPSGSGGDSVCVVRIDGTMATGGKVYGEATYTGVKRSMASCTGGGGAGNTGEAPTTGNSKPPVAGEPAPTPCGAGQAPGTVNGHTGCYPAGATGEPVTTTKKIETTTPNPVEGQQPDTAGSIGETQCVGAQCTTKTTTTTTTNVNGVATTTTGTTTKTESKGDYCKDNPNSEQCKTGSFGGSCSAGFKCDGDAVMCAVAKEMHQRNCALFDVQDTDAAKLFASSLAAASAAVGSAQGPVVERSLESSIKTNNALSVGASCITDRQVQIMGKAINVPLSRVCPYLDMLGTALVAVGMLAAAVIVFRG